MVNALMNHQAAADAGRSDRLWQAMVSVAPAMIPLFTQAQPSLSGGHKINFDMNQWAAMVAQVSKTLVEAHARASS